MLISQEIPAEGAFPPDKLGDRLIAAAMHLEMAVAGIRSHPDYATESKKENNHLATLTQLLEELLRDCYTLYPTYGSVAAEEVPRESTQG